MGRGQRSAATERTKLSPETARLLGDIRAVHAVLALDATSDGVLFEALVRYRHLLTTREGAWRELVDRGRSMLSRPPKAQPAPFTGPPPKVSPVVRYDP